MWFTHDEVSGHNFWSGNRNDRRDGSGPHVAYREFAEVEADGGRDILRAVYDALEPGGAFVAYQVRDRVHTLGCEVFGRARVQTELLNVPPMRIYRWEKHAAPASERL